MGESAEKFNGRKFNMKTSYLPLMTFCQWDPSSATLMEEV